MARTTPPVSPTRSWPSGEERLGPLGLHAEEHPHLGDAGALEPVHERVAGLERLVVCATAEGGMLPLGRPPLGPQAELLLEVDAAAGRFEQSSQHPQEAAEAGM